MYRNIVTNPLCLSRVVTASSFVMPLDSNVRRSNFGYLYDRGRLCDKPRKEICRHGFISIFVGLLSFCIVFLLIGCIMNGPPSRV